jgi:hypothetical protein
MNQLDLDCAYLDFIPDRRRKRSMTVLWMFLALVTAPALSFQLCVLLQNCLLAYSFESRDGVSLEILCLLGSAKTKHL